MLSSTKLTGNLNIIVAELSTDSSFRAWKSRVEILSGLGIISLILFAINSPPPPPSNYLLSFIPIKKIIFPFILSYYFRTMNLSTYLSLFLSEAILDLW